MPTFQDPRRTSYGSMRASYLQLCLTVAVQKTPSELYQVFWSLVCPVANLDVQHCNSFSFGHWEFLTMVPRSEGDPERRHLGSFEAIRWGAPRWFQWLAEHCIHCIHCHVEDIEQPKKAPPKAVEVKRNSKERQLKRQHSFEKKDGWRGF